MKASWMHLTQRWWINMKEKTLNEHLEEMQISQGKLKDKIDYLTTKLDRKDKWINVLCIWLRRYIDDK